MASASAPQWPRRVLPHHQEYEQLGGKVVEHRVRRRRVSSGWGSAAALALAVIVAAYLANQASLPYWRGWAALAIAVALASRWGVLYQSLTPLPDLGIQLGTARGLRLFGHEFEMAKSKRFVALANLSTVVIHEGLVRWGVRYYLAIVGAGVVVAFEDVNPAPEVLEEVYHCVREVLFDEYASESDIETRDVSQVEKELRRRR